MKELIRYSVNCLLDGNCYENQLLLLITVVLYGAVVISSKRTRTIIEKSQKRIAGIILNKSSSKIDTNTLKDMHWLTSEKKM